MLYYFFLSRQRCSGVLHIEVIPRVRTAVEIWFPLASDLDRS
ncbi:hypothetical protein RISK_003408 [Rhodopirellula islandica]|uniref:Uncharacterized protein n=1 Tax=Rhodopirellula islandica TaxID=595434 RepID=A0A0J1EFR6_RHOIS|nr:hypothetical protein RISK_003408 [Rhodopirellula islandica]